MKFKLLLRIAAIIMLLHAIGHTVGVATWKIKGDVPAEVVQIMQTSPFSFMGEEGATMARFYDGFGYCGSIFLFFISVLLWVVAGIKDKSAIKVLWVAGMAIIALAIDEMIYFFPMAVAFCLVSATLVFISIGMISESHKLVES